MGVSNLRTTREETRTQLILPPFFNCQGLNCIFSNIENSEWIFILYPQTIRLWVIVFAASHPRTGRLSGLHDSHHRMPVHIFQREVHQMGIGVDAHCVGVRLGEAAREDQCLLIFTKNGYIS